MESHPTSDEIVRFLGSQTAQENRRFASHLLECAQCRRLALQTLRPVAEPPGAGKVLQYRPSANGQLGGGTAAWRERLRAAVREVEEGEALMAELKRHPRHRWPLIVRHQERFHTLAVAQRLVAESRDAVFEEPRAGVQVAELALAVLADLDPAVYGGRLLDDVRGRAWTAIGAGRRLANDFDGAEEAFRRAGELLAETADPLEQGGYLYRLAALRRDQRRFDEGRTLLDRARELFSEAGDDRMMARALTSLGLLHLDEGMPAEALPPLLEAIERVDESDDPRTALYARHNLAMGLAELGECDQARRLVLGCQDAYARSGDAHILLRARWLEGVIAAGSGDQARGEALFRDVRAVLLERGQAYDAALASLDLATLLAAQGRSVELRELAEEMATTFLAFDIHREAAAALAFFRHAVLHERASADLVAAIGRYLKRARNRPDLSFAAGI